MGYQEYIYKGEQDARTGDKVTIQVEHNKIHDSKHYFASSYVTGLTTSGYTWIFRTPATNYVHYLCSLKSGLNGSFSLYENCTASSDGSAVSIFNFNRLSANTSGCTLFNGAVLSATGTALQLCIIGTDGTNPVGATGGTNSREYELILKQNTTYGFKYLPLNSGDRAEYSVEFYVED